jgi:hypothetical protein
MAYVQPTPGGFKVRWREGGRGSPLLASPVYAEEAQARDAAADIGAGLLARRALSESKAHGAALPLLEVVHRWSAARVADRGITERYAKRTTKMLRELADRMGWETVADITPAEVDRWRITNGGRNARLGASLRAVLRWAEERLRQPVPPGSWVALRPARTARRPRRDLPAAKDLARWQLRADEVSDDAGALVHCLLTYGWRPIAAARMLVSDFDAKRGTILLRDLKGTGDDLVHPILPATAKRLRGLAEGRKPADPLFVDPRSGKAWIDEEGGHGMSWWWREHVTRDRGIYDLKRHAISGMLARGLAPQDVALFTGHRSLSQVLIYARTNEERARAALAMIGGRGPGSSRGKRPAAEGARRVHGVARGGIRRSGGAA